MKKLLAILSLSALLTASIYAEVVRPAPQFSWTGAQGKSQTLKSVKGQPAVLLVARSPKQGRYKNQIKRLEELYRQFAGREALFFVAFTESEGRPGSDIPFIQVQNPQQIGSQYLSLLEGAPEFAIAVIAPDGNLDMITDEVVPAGKIRDVIDNSYQVQSKARKSGN